MKITPLNTLAKGVKFFRVLSDSGNEYIVTLDTRKGETLWKCSCPDYTFRGQIDKRPCKHCVATQETILREKERAS